MKKQATETTGNFKGATIYAGIDVHRKRWVVTIRFAKMEMKTFSMNPDPDELVQHLRKNYPGATYKAVYEAGFCGFWICDALMAGEVECLVVHAADVPTTHKEKVSKTDARDSRKLAKELEKGGLEGIHVPSRLLRQLRSLSRLRGSLTKDQTRLKNRIKSHLYFFGIELSEVSESKHWSANFIRDLETLTHSDNAAASTLRHLLNSLKDVRRNLLQVVQDLRKYLREHYREALSSLQSVPGVGFVTAATLITEIGDPKRFRNEDRFASYVGFVPSTHNSGETNKTLGLTPRRNRRLKHLIIEASWTAVRKDPDLAASFHQYSLRMLKTDAIIRIAGKLLNRIRHVWQHGATYQVQLPSQ